MSTKQNVRARSGLVQVRLLLIMFAISAIAAWLVAFPVAGRRQTANAAPPRLENPQETKQAEAFQKAGTEGDSSKVAAMIQTLQGKPQEYVAESAMHSLALLGASEAIPVLDDYINGDLADVYGFGAPYIKADAQIAKARLLAEIASSIAANSSSQADVKTRKFFEELHLTPADLNTAVAEYSQHGPEEMNKPAPLEVKVIRELADMAYQGSYQNFTSLPAVRGVLFASDSISNLKVQLAPLSRTNRAAWLVHDLAQTKQIHRSGALMQSKADEMRLAVSEGLPASQAAANLLQQMEKQRNQYSPIAFATLFSVLEGTGDRSQDALLLHFSRDADPYIAQQARISRQILNNHSR
jgi:hypothetical protein